MTHKNILFLCTAISFICSVNGGPVPTANEQKKIENVVIDASEKALERIPHFTGLNTDFLCKVLSGSDLDTYKIEISHLNRDHNQEDLWIKKNWDLTFYNRLNLPVTVGVLKHPEKFTAFRNGVGLRFLDLPLHMPGQGWRIPPQLEQFNEVIAMVVKHERAINPDFEKDHYVYITVDQGIVAPHTAQRRAGWHGDSYRHINSVTTPSHIPTDNLYVIADSCPTPFVPGPFDLSSINPENVDEVLALFKETAERQKAVTYPSYTLLKMDPYCIHDAGINDGDTAINRTFVKISISKTKYCKLGNAHNQLFIYDWPMLPRHHVPYTKKAIVQSSHRKDRDRFEEIDLTAVDFLQKTCNVSWAKPTIFSAYKIASIKAEAAQEGDIIETRNDDFIITVNVAEKGDWKVYSTADDVYFMSHERFTQAYEPHSQNKDVYIPKKNIRRVVELTKDIRLKGPWDSIQYAKAGDYLVYVDSKDIHAVPKKLFEETYKTI